MVSDGQKFLWDGQQYDSKEEAYQIGKSYQGDNFQTLVVEENGKFLVYTRRIVKEAVVAGQ